MKSVQILSYFWSVFGHLSLSVFLIFIILFLVLTQSRIFKELKKFTDELVATLHTLSTNNFIGLFRLIVIISSRG